MSYFIAILSLLNLNGYFHNNYFLSYSYIIGYYPKTFSKSVNISHMFKLYSLKDFSWVFNLLAKYNLQAIAIAVALGKVA